MSRAFKLFCRQLRVLFSCMAIVGSGLVVHSAAMANDGAVAVPTASLTIHNRSAYKMSSSIWNNGDDCSDRMVFEPSLNINENKEPRLTVLAGHPIAVGVAIFELGDKLPVVCDYILSFTLNPSTDYSLVFDTLDRRCYGQLFEHKKNGTQQLIVEDGTENFMERFPEFGWDQFEPGCMTE